MKAPQYEFTPFGYLDNPAHTAHLHISGVVRSVPPMGFGFWKRSLPWTYASGVCPSFNNYLSFLRLSLITDKVRISNMEEAKAQKVCSKIHSKNLMSYDWEGHGLSFSVTYLLADEETIACDFEIKNELFEEQKVTLRVSNLYGFVEKHWWGSSGLVSRYVSEKKAWINKIWEGGAVFIMGADDAPLRTGLKFYKEDDDPSQWVGDELNDLGYGTKEFSEIAGAESFSDYSFTLDGKSSRVGHFYLVRERNEAYAWRRFCKIKLDYDNIKHKKMAEDEEFYSRTPILEGDWSDSWKQGWVQDWETLRMTVRPPVGIYTTPWDAMQIFSPRCVLGETHLDMMCFSYADPETAKEVIYGCFKDAPMPNVPCSREDGSMNMIGAGGSECGTSPVWGLPFYVIRSIFFREHDLSWLRKLYPYLRAFISWWLENRTDAEGWFHCNNSWESGQDGSKRFTFDGCNESDVVDFVRTVDVEAVMAHAMESMAVFAKQLGLENDIPYWQDMAKERIKRTREMFFEGWFRDFDARSNKPIVLKDYYDVMMLLPITVGVALPEQIDEMRSSFKYFIENPKLMLEWPSFQFPFTEAARRANQTEMVSDLLLATGDRVYARETSREVRPLASRHKTTFPNCFRYKMPGQASEFWPLVPDPVWECGAEHYGWGATLPTMVIRNIFGIRELETDYPSIEISPTVPTSWKEGSRYGLTNFHIGPFNFDIFLTPVEGGVKVTIDFATPEAQHIEKTLKPGEKLTF